VRARAVLVDQRAVRFEHTFTVEEAVSGGQDEDFVRVVDALARALTRAVDQIGERVETELTTLAELELPTSGSAAAAVR
jgi:hypothetical protein